MVIEIYLFGNQHVNVIVVSKKQAKPQETENIEEIDRHYAKQLQLQSIYDFSEKSLNIPIFYSSNK